MKNVNKNAKGFEVFSVFYMQKVRSHGADSVKAVLVFYANASLEAKRGRIFYVREEESLSSTFRKILLTYCSQSQENQ